MATKLLERIPSDAFGARIGKRIEQVRDMLCPAPYVPRRELSLADVAITAVLAAIAAAYAAAAFSMIDPRAYDSWNIYFHADGIRVLADMTERFSDQWRTNVHPLIPALTYYPMQLLMGLGLDKLAAAAVLLVGCAATTTGMLYLALRGLGLSIPSAVIFAFVFISSATFVHWFAYIETYAFAALTTSIALFVLTRSQTKSFWVWVAASAGVLSITVTNWGLALAAGFFRLPFWTFARTTAAAFGVVAVLAWAQMALFPNAVLFFNPYKLKGDVSFSQIWLQSKGYGTWTPMDNIRAILVTSAIAPPPIKEVYKTPVGDFVVVNNLHSPILSMSTAGIVAAACWILMLGVGLWGAVRSIPHRAVALTLGVFILFQILMHSVYGEITFLYAGNFFPALFMLTALGYFTPLRRIVLGAAATVAILGGLNNYAQFSEAARLSGEVAAHLEATGTALCVPTCESAPQAPQPIPQ